jgi:hypothetical protein
MIRPRQMGPNGPEPFLFPIPKILLGIFFFGFLPIRILLGPNGILYISCLCTNLPIRIDNSLIYLNKIRFFIPVFIGNLNFYFSTLNKLVILSLLKEFIIIRLKSVFINYSTLNIKAAKSL